MFPWCREESIKQSVMWPRCFPAQGVQFHSGQCHPMGANGSHKSRYRNKYLTWLSQIFESSMAHANCAQLSPGKDQKLFLAYIQIFSYSDKMKMTPTVLLIPVILF